MNNSTCWQPLLWVVTIANVLTSSSRAESEMIPRFGIYEAVFKPSGSYNNPYTDVMAEALLNRPDHSSRAVPLFWDGDVWKLRICPDLTGSFSYEIRSNDGGLDGNTGWFSCVDSDKRGSIQPMVGAPHHFQFQNGKPMWYFGDTAWSLFQDDAEENLDREATFEYIRTRSDQGFNVVHATIVSENGLGNSGGLPFEDLNLERINIDYFQEIDRRLAFANSQGIVVGMVLDWADKSKTGRFPWRNFPGPVSRKRFARYVASRYSAYDVYFIVSGEWQGEIGTRESSYEEVKQEFMGIGDVLAASDPHGRMIGIHPIAGNRVFGRSDAPSWSVRDYQDANWMSFGDYQQNYEELHGRVLEAMKYAKPVVNSEYGYHLRDRDGDGVPDKDNSTCLESIRHASWDIVMAGGYLVTGFGTTYMGGRRDPSPFDIHAMQNDEWERQVSLMGRLFNEFDWWKLTSHDRWITCATLRDPDSRHLGRVAPPEKTYWLLADPGHQYVAYTRGLNDKLTIQLGPNASGIYSASLLNPRTGERQTEKNSVDIDQEFAWTPHDTGDWVMILTKSRELTGIDVDSGPGGEK